MRSVSHKSKSWCDKMRNALQVQGKCRRRRNNIERAQHTIASLATREGYRWRAGRRREPGSGLVCSHHQILMIILLTVFHVIVCIFLILVVLLQQGKGADWAGRFRRRRHRRRRSARAAPEQCLSKATTAAAIIFMITSLALTILISEAGRLFGNSRRRQTAANPPAPATPGQPAQPGNSRLHRASSRQRQQPPATPATPAPAPAATDEYEVSAPMDAVGRLKAEVVELADTPS